MTSPQTHPFLPSMRGYPGPHPTYFIPRFTRKVRDFRSLPPLSFLKNEKNFGFWKISEYSVGFRAKKTKSLDGITLKERSVLVNRKTSPLKAGSGPGTYNEEGCFPPDHQDGRKSTSKCSIKASFQSGEAHADSQRRFRDPRLYRLSQGNGKGEFHLLEALS